MPQAPGCFPKDFGDGLNGMTVPTLCLLTNLRPDGTMFQIEDSTLSAILDMENSPQSMSIITTYTLKPTKNLERPEVSKVPTPDHSFQRASSLTRTNGEKYTIHYLLLL